MSKRQHHPALKDTATLLSALTAVCREARTIKIAAGKSGLLDALNSSVPEMSFAASLRLHELANRLKEVVVKDERFPGDSVRMIRRDAGASNFYPDFMCVPLIRKAIETGSAEKAIDWLLKVLAVKNATGKTIGVLWGVPVKRKIELSTNVKIVPIDDLPESYQKQWILGRSNSRNEALVASMLEFSPPKSALVMQRRIEPYIYDPDVQHPIAVDDFIQLDEQLKDIALALTAVGPRVPILAAQWFTFDDPDLEQADRGGGFRRMHLLEILPNRPSDYPMLDATDAPRVVQRYLALTDPTRTKVRLALQRLNQAQRRHSVGDRAVDLSIALETLLLDRSEDDKTNKLKKRSAKLINGNSDVTKENGAVIHYTYDFRSDLMHAGKNTSGVRKINGKLTDVSTVLDRAAVLCAELTKIIINRGKIPAW